MRHALKLLRWPTGLLLLLLPSSTLFGDWVELTDGAVLRGIRYQTKGKRGSFILENGRTISLDPAQVAAVVKSPPDEKVEFRGKMVPLPEKVQAMQVEEDQRRREAILDLECWALGKERAEAARQAFAALSEEDRARYLAVALHQSELKEARALAARELGRHQGPLPVAALSRAAVIDRQVPVRLQSLASLKAIADPATTEAFLPWLGSPRERERLNAVSALEQFPSQKAVPALIETMDLIYTGFGRGYFFQGVERAYISDYELVSGGTGYQIIEVADPVISKVTTGVVLDAHVKRVEMEARRTVLRKITGQDFGTDVKRWREWWSSNQTQNQKQ